ncbi:SDR family oxidoreductase [Brevundimonas sp.]|uniref:SDR family oxidoreductase n=1 Tax=Brevundimonas sp. TaxID=1871086 RepID=UPI00272F7EDD|nr:SDR family oxidoreductase [Brevundimonas sp.]MDP1912755.1 SDR family oxidoreductase [Brevundimonas sp.]
MNTSRWRLLLFGGSGAIGQAIGDRARALGWSVTAVSRSQRPDTADRAWVQYDPAGAGISTADFGLRGPFDAVCWAQGANRQDSVMDFDATASAQLYEANCLYIARSLNELLAANLLSPAGARLCVVSSIWQERARQSKLSYTMTKAALGGFVRSASVDLAADGHLINAVLPGVLDTPMTHAALAPEQVERVARATPFNALPTPDGIARLVGFLCSDQNTVVTGQSITADLGFSNVRLV